MRTRFPVLGATAAALTAAALAWPAPAQAAPVHLSQGHVDAIDVAYESG